VLSHIFVSFLKQSIRDFEDVTFVACQGRSIDLQLGIYVHVLDENNSSVRGRNILKDAETTASLILNEGGYLGEITKCGSSGILLYFAIHDYVGYKNGHITTMAIARGGALEFVLPDTVLHKISNDVDPYFEHDQYEAAIMHAIKKLNDSIQESEAAQEDVLQWVMPLCVCFSVLMTCLRVLLIRLLSSNGRPIVFRHGLLQRIRRRKNVERLLQQVRQNQSMGNLLANGGNHYMTAKCPICLESFQSSFVAAESTNSDRHQEASETTPLLLGDDSDVQYTRKGSDGKPILVLPCGHNFDLTCIARWISTQLLHNAEPSCPICLAKVTVPPAMMIR